MVLILGFILFQAFAGGGENTLSIPQFGEASLENRVSEHYINKSVNSETESITFNQTLNPESGSANYVTSIIANYRALDTLGEVTVLFIAAAGLAFVLGGNQKNYAFA